MYIWVKLRNEIFRKSILGLILLSFLFIFILNLFENSLKEPVVFRINIIDEDNTKLSEKAVQSIKKLDGVSIIKNKADAEYIIKKGFAEYFSKGRFDGLIEVKKNSFKSGISLLNDRIATRLVSDYIYLDLYHRIKSEQKISFDEYEKTLAKTRLENEILSIAVNDRKIDNKFNADINYSSYIIIFFLLLVSLSIAANQMVKLNKIRNNGVLYRLKLSGIRESGIILDEIMISFIKCMIVILPFLITRSELKAYIITVILFCLNLPVSYILERISKSEEGLVFSLRVIMVLFLAVGMFVNFYF